MNLFQLNFTVINKAVDGTSIKGTTIGAYGLCGSLGILLIDELGGYLFKKNTVLPFIICLASVSIFTVVTIILAILKKL